jgi:hypothetical protein
MRPGLSDGDGVLAVRSGRARVGERRVYEHPFHPGMWLVKRVAAVDPDGRMRVASDDPTATGADSRTFGALPVEGSYRVLLRVRRAVPTPRTP